LAPLIQIVTGLNWIVFERDDFQNIPAGIVRFLRLVETCLELNRLQGSEPVQPQWLGALSQS